MNFALIVGAVQPTYFPTRSARPTSTITPVERKSFSFMIRAKNLATVVLAVPGFPVKTMCIDGRSAFMPLSAKSRCARCISSACSITFLALSRPIISISSS